MANSHFQTGLATKRIAKVTVKERWELCSNLQSVVNKNMCMEQITIGSMQHATKI